MIGCFKVCGDLAGNVVRPKKRLYGLKQKPLVLGMPI